MSNVTSGTVVSTFKQTHFYTKDEIMEFEKNKKLELKKRNNKLSKNNRTIEAVHLDCCDLTVAISNNSE